MARTKTRNQDFPLKENDVVIYLDYNNRLHFGVYKNNHV